MSRRYYFRKQGRKFVVCDSETDQRVFGKEPLDTYEEACAEVNRMNRGN